MSLYCGQPRGPRKSDPEQNFKNPLGSFFRIQLGSMCAKFQLSSSKTVGGDRGDGRTDGRTDDAPLPLYVHVANFKSNQKSTSPLHFVRFAHSARGG